MFHYMYFMSLDGMKYRNGMKYRPYATTTTTTTTKNENKRQMYDSQASMQSGIHRAFQMSAIPRVFGSETWLHC